jgi:catechol 2,3-dioxygenase-like lactoylglutathione lyase family enzyme
MGAGQAQPLTLIMDSPYNDVTLGVFEANNNILLDPARKLRAWQTVLPATEQYTIQVIGGATTENFTLTVKLPLVVNFASGASSTTLNGTTVNGYLFSYALNCAAGQTMNASLNVPASIATIDIYGISSGVLVDAAAGYASWSGVLPQTQDYVIEVVPANNHVVNFSLTVSCTGTGGNTYYPTGNPSTGGTLYFLPGETMSVVQGTIQPGQVVTYSVQAQQYQPLAVIVGSPNGDAVLGVLDPNGNRLLDPASQYTYWQWQLPITGLYTIQVVGGITSENFTLTTKLGRLYTYPAAGNSIIINATTVRGLIKSYAFRLSAGVVMTLSLNVPSTTAYLDVYGVQTGSILNASARANTWTGTMPSTQTYVVEVIPGGTMSAYTLTISNP